MKRGERLPKYSINTLKSFAVGNQPTSVVPNVLLVEACAKLMGYTVTGRTSASVGEIWISKGQGIQGIYCPLLNPGQAMELVLKLRMDIQWRLIGKGRKTWLCRVRIGEELWPAPWTRDLLRAVTERAAHFATGRSPKDGALLPAE